MDPQNVERVLLRPEIARLAAYAQGRVPPADGFKLSSNENPFDPLPGVLAAMTRVRASVAALTPATLPAVEDFMAILEDWRPGRELRRAAAFAPWFGRGQQYLSLVRRDGA